MALLRRGDAGNRQTKYNAIPIRMYRVVHAGANSQLGGLKKGLFRVAYHVPMAVAVANPAIPPTASVINKAYNSFILL